MMFNVATIHGTYYMGLMWSFSTLSHPISGGGFCCLASIFKWWRSPCMHKQKHIERGWQSLSLWNKVIFKLYVLCELKMCQRDIGRTMFCIIFVQIFLMRHKLLHNFLLSFWIGFSICFSGMPCAYIWFDESAWVSISLVFIDIECKCKYRNRIRFFDIISSASVATRNTRMSLYKLLFNSSGEFLSFQPSSSVHIYRRCTQSKQILIGPTFQYDT